MVRKIKLSVYYGTRPEFLKLYSPIVQFRQSECIVLRAVNTGQHKELLDPVQEEFSFIPDVTYSVMKKTQGMEDLYSHLITTISQDIKETHPDAVMAQGDTATVFCTALAAYLNKISFIHLEAGMRTNDKFSPFPEEMNRRMTSCIADIHLCWTDVEKDNLISEGFSTESIFVTGNTLIDTLFDTYDKDYDFDNQLPEKLIKEISTGKKIVFITQHRRENMGEKHSNIFEAIIKILENNKDHIGVFPVHYNPEVRKPAYETFADVGNMYLLEPLPYKPFINLMARSSCIITDSGGLQEEAPSFGVPVLVTRDKTERPLVVDQGKAFLVGDNEHEITRTFNRIRKKWNYDDISNPYGDGKSAKRILKMIRERYMKK